MFYVEPHKIDVFAKGLVHGFGQKLEIFRIGIFANGLVHGFGQKLEILLTFRFMQNTRRKSIW